MRSLLIYINLLHLYLGCYKKDRESANAQGEPIDETGNTISLDEAGSDNVAQGNNK